MKKIFTFAAIAMAIFTGIAASAQREGLVITDARSANNAGTLLTTDNMSGPVTKIMAMAGDVNVLFVLLYFTLHW